MGTNVVSVNRVLIPTGVSMVTEGDASPWSVGDRLLMVFAAFIALVFSASALALMVISIRAFFSVT
jgi:hypothetical protein